MYGPAAASASHATGPGATAALNTLTTTGSAASDGPNALSLAALATEPHGHAGPGGRASDARLGAAVSAQQLLSAYIEDSGSCAVFGPLGERLAAAAGGPPGGGRSASLDLGPGVVVGAGGLGSSGAGSRHELGGGGQGAALRCSLDLPSASRTSALRHASHAPHVPSWSGSPAGARGGGAGGAAPLPPGVAGGRGSVEDGGGGAGWQAGTGLGLGVLNTIHSVNASHAGPAEQDVADL